MTEPEPVFRPERSSVRRFASLIVISAAGAAIGFATYAAPRPTGPDSHNPAAGSVRITPHRAIYDMQLSGVKNGSNVSGATGRMMFEWRDVCDGWAVQQYMQLHFSYTDGDDQDVKSTQLSWEAKDGHSYDFNIRRTSNGKETENYRGKATLDDKGGGTAIYSIPAGKTVTLPPGTLFPTTHTELILNDAAHGDKLFTRYVFDGSDESGGGEVSAFILAQRAAATVALKTPASSLVSEPYYPVHLAFFGKDTASGAPDYEMDMQMEPDGIARRMSINYGDFAVTGTLASLQALPAQACP